MGEALERAGLAGTTTLPTLGKDDELNTLLPWCWKDTLPVELRSQKVGFVDRLPFVYEKTVIWISIPGCWNQPPSERPGRPAVPAKRGAIEPSDHALGRSRGGLTTKIHLLCDRHGFPITFSLSAGQRADSTQLTGLLEKVRSPGRLGCPRKRSRYIVADKGYDSDALRHYCTRYGMRPIIPRRRMYRCPRPGLPHQFDRPKYRQRNVVERLLGWLKEKRRLNTRYDKLASSFKAMMTLACIERCMRADFSDRT